MLCSTAILMRVARIGVRRDGPVKQCLGITLIELLVVVTIAAILAAIAYPSYRAQVLKTRRADAEAVLMQAAQYMERLYTENGCYNGVACNSTKDNLALPFSKSPIDGADAYYTIRLTALEKRAFTLRATPQGPEAGSGILEIDNTGQHRRDRNNDGAFDVTTDDGW